MVVLKYILKIEGAALIDGFDGEDFYGREEQGENGRYPDEKSHWEDTA